MKGKVHIVDDDEGVRKGLKLLMDSVQLEAATYASAQEFLAHLESAGGVVEGCVVMDVRMPEMSGLELQALLARRGCRLPVIVMSGHGHIAMAVRAMQAGAVTFLEKPIDEQELIDQIFRALRPPRPPTPAGQVVLARYREKLTPRQAEVFDLLIQGLQTKPIALQLGLSPRTVEVHRAKILERLGMPSFAALLTTALVPDPPSEQAAGSRTAGKDGE